MTNFAQVCRKLRERLRPLGDLRIEAGEIEQAAVALILRHGDSQGEILIIKRAEHPSDPWSGHLALPGGRAESDDVDLRAVAVRETLEEVGIDLAAGGEWIGRLDQLQPVTRRLPLIAVMPLVAIAPPDVSPSPNLREVEDAFWMPLAELKRTGRTDCVRLILHGQAREWPAYPSPRGAIWGMTERILTQFLALID